MVSLQQHRQRHRRLGRECHLFSEYQLGEFTIVAMLCNFQLTSSGTSAVQKSANHPSLFLFILKMSYDIRIGLIAVVDGHSRGSIALCLANSDVTCHVKRG